VTRAPQGEGGGPAVVDRLRRGGRAHLDGPVPVFAATETLGASTATADDAAEAWLVRHAPPAAGTAGTADADPAEPADAGPDDAEAGDPDDGP
jgi:hypothetical protein